MTFPRSLLYSLAAIALVGCEKPPTVKINGSDVTFPVLLEKWCHAENSRNEYKAQAERLQEENSHLRHSHEVLSGAVAHHFKVCHPEQPCACGPIPAPCKCEPTKSCECKPPGGGSCCDEPKGVAAPPAPAAPKPPVRQCPPNRKCR